MSRLKLVHGNYPHYDGTPPHAKDSDTSKLAAKLIKKKVGALSQDVYHALLAKGNRGATAFEIVQETGMLLQTVCPRIRELVLKGLVRDSGMRRNIRIKGRGSATVWELVP
jgi:DNA-binding MarR family transcriptional regulator